LLQAIAKLAFGSKLPSLVFQITWRFARIYFSKTLSMATQMDLFGQQADSTENHVTGLPDQVRQ